MGKNILLINPSCRDSEGINESTIYPPLGLGYLVSYVKKYSKNNHRFKIIDANLLNLDNNHILNIIQKSKPDIVGIYMNSVSAIKGFPLGKYIKNNFKGIKVVFGGPLPSAMPIKVMEQYSCDINVIGEGEETFKEICDEIPLKKIRGICYHNGTEIVLNEKRDYIQDLDKIPFPSYELFPDLKKYKARSWKKPIGPVLFTRGCPFHCTFCNKSVYGDKLRYHSKEYAIRLMKHLKYNFKVKQIDVIDDNFTFDLMRAEEIFDEIKKEKINLPIHMLSGVRGDFINERLVQKMKRAGVFKVAIGIESGDPKILEDIHKSLSLDKVISAIRLFRKYRIQTHGLLMIGFPNETEEAIRNTIKFTLKANPNVMTLNRLVPLPGTEIYEYLKMNNKLKYPESITSNYGFYSNQAIYDCNYLSEQKINALWKEAYLKFYFRPSKMLEMLSTIKSSDDLRWFYESAMTISRNVIFHKNIKTKPSS